MVGLKQRPFEFLSLLGNERLGFRILFGISKFATIKVKFGKNYPKFLSFVHLYIEISFCKKKLRDCTWATLKHRKELDEL